MMLNKGVLVTGGSGSFGSTFIRHALNSGARRVVCYSRDEKKQFDLEQSLRDHPHFDALRLFLGDVRDSDRLEMAMRDIDIVVHAAALKRIEAAERDPIEAVRTNILGSMNVIIASLRTGVKKAIALSTDKACDPINLYGATKMTMERLFIAANNLAAGRCKFVVVRYGNVSASRGSVIPLWQQQIAKGEPVRITEPNATRFYMTLDEAVELVLYAIKSQNGEVFTPPNLPAYRLGDLAVALEAIGDIVGLPWYEKLHESLGDGQTSDRARRMSIDELREAIARLG